MKKMIFIITLFAFSNSFSQSIRKSFTELTISEKSELQSALYKMRDINDDGIVSNNINSPDSDDLFLDLAKFHKDFFRYTGTNNLELDIHFNLPYQNDIQIFFGWHRQQMFELEQALQEINPKISLAYWDSSVEQDLVTLQNTLFGPDLLGPFNSDWNLGRVLNSGVNALPTPAEVVTAQSYTDFATSTGTETTNTSYSNRLERDSPHVGAHIWTGGAMPTPASPADPVFYFHHSWIDKLWTEWEVANPGSSSFIIQSMIRYDGSYVFNGATLPLINPNNFTNTRSLGVFYAENQLAELDNYTVNNTFKTIENFYYQYTIEVGNNFNVPNGKNCKIESVNMIVLEPEFVAVSGSTFTAKIDTDADITTSARGEITQNRYNPIDFGSDIDKHAYENLSFEEPKENNINNTKVYPNPFKSSFNLNFTEIYKNILVEIYDISGRQVLSKSYSNTSKIEVKYLDFLSSGTYILKVSSENNVILNTKVLKL